MMPDLQQVGEGETQQWAPNVTAPVVLLENVSKSYGKIHALSEITLALSGGVTGILGSNGAGKSTLFNALTKAGIQSFEWKYPTLRYRPMEEPCPICKSRFRSRA